MAILSLIFLIVPILLGIFLKVNIGLCAFGASLVLGLISKTPTKTIQGGFPTGLFITLLGVMTLFSIAQENKTMENLARKVVSLAGKRTFLIPIIVYVFSVILAAVGPGTIPVMGIMAVFTCSLAAEMRISPILLSATSVLGAAGGGVTPIAPTGILGLSLAAKQGIEGIAVPYAVNMLIAMTTYFIIIYFVLGGYKMKSNVDVSEVTQAITFDRNQMITLTGMVVMVVLVIGLGFEVGLTSFTVSMILLLLKVCNEKKAIANIPWGTLLMVTGIQMIMAMTISLGGIKLLANGLSKFMTPRTAPGILGLTAGIMSWFSSTSGVVMPTLIPTATGIVENVGGGVTALSLISAVTNTASAAGMSPLSTGGSMGMAAYSAIAKPTEEEHGKLFLRLFLVSAGGVVVVALVAVTGVYNLLL
ncbi:MAG: hypothetical protein LBT51_05650 [Fusobacteriaceae bacterium]|jgi:di/tricarboxylate transporter|nr:hypothetical protein [Fusobacteriaceae bacterium]